METNFSSEDDSFETQGEKKHLALKIIQAVTLSGIMIVGTLANGIICNCIFKKRNVLFVTNVFIFNLASTDFLICVLCMPFALVSSITHRWVFGDAMCVVAGFVLTVLRIASILALALVAIDRYLAIAHPLKYCTLITRRTSFTMVGCSWTQAVICALLPAVGWGKGYRYVEEESICRPRLVSPVDDHGFTVFLFVTCFLVPFSVIGFTYFSILWTARRQFRQVHHAKIPHSLLINVQPPATQLNEQPTPSLMRARPQSGPTAIVGDEITSATNGTIRSRRRRNVGPKQKTRGFKMLMIIVVVFLICWCPHFILLFYSGLANYKLPLTVRALTAWLTFLNSLCNPFLYGFLNSKFRTSLKKFLDQKVLCCKWKQNEGSQVFHVT